MKKTKKALITGITGQDGSYLAELLLSKGYEVYGIIRRSSTFNTGRIDHIYKDLHSKDARLFLYYGDLSSSEGMANIISNVNPDEVYHLGAQSHVKVSFFTPEYTGDTTGLGTTRLLESIRITGKKIKFYQASSSEMFGSAKPPQNEKTHFEPRSPYAAAKAYAYWMTVNYREGYNMFASNGMLFNHESPRRGETFVTRKITRAVANIVAGKQKYLYLGNMDAKRDWGFAPEYVEVMWKMLQKKKPADYVIGTGRSISVRQFVNQAFRYAGLDPKKHLKVDKRYMRPTDVSSLKADPSKARKELNWKLKIQAEDLIKIMVDADLRAAGVEAVGEGDKIIKKKFPQKWWKGD
ncbi:MAG: GDP-mannose 4,6-dehydratase [Candidatus Tantalella remota]|nr:GDP-mannose 4,6-dehydratase [Candidatus Tantalella remota]